VTRASLCVAVISMAAAVSAEAAKKKRRSPPKEQPPVVQPAEPAPAAGAADAPAEDIPDPWSNQKPNPWATPSTTTTTKPAASPAPVRTTEKRTVVPAAPRTKLEVALGGRGFYRRLRFRDDVFDRFHPHDIAAPALAFDAAVYRWENLGFVGRGSYVTGLESEDASGLAYETSAYTVQGGATTRFGSGRIDLGIAALVGFEGVALSAKGLPPRSGVVSTRYLYLRPELWVRYRLSEDLGIAVDGGYMYILSAGELEDEYFSRLEGAGVGFTAGAAYSLTSEVFILAGADYRRFFFDAHAKPGDPFVVGGLTDEQIGVTLCIAYRQ
jgi:hypothetical protein